MSGTRLVGLQTIEQPPTESEAMLDSLLRSMRRKAKSNRLFAGHPTLGAAARRFLWLVSPSLLYPFGKRTIAEICLLHAIDNAAKGGVTAPCGFIEGLLAHATMLLEIKVVHGDAVWNPIASAPLMEWLQVHPDATVEAADGTLQLPAPRRFAAAVGMRILDPVDYVYLDRWTKGEA